MLKFEPITRPMPDDLRAKREHALGVANNTIEQLENVFTRHQELRASGQGLMRELVARLEQLQSVPEAREVEPTEVYRGLDDLERRANQAIDLLKQAYDELDERSLT